MSKSINALRKLEHALSDTRYALNEVIHVLQESSSKPHPQKSNNIIPPYRFEAKLEEHQMGEQLDQTYKELQLKEWKLKAAYQNPQNADKHDSLLAELDSIQQQMTDIERQLYYTEDDI